MNEDRGDIEELQEEEAVHENRRLRLGIPQRGQQRLQQQDQNPQLHALHASTDRRGDLPDGQEAKGGAPQSSIGGPHHTVLITDIALPPY